MAATTRSWWLAATLSTCVPGLGQVYNGQLLRGCLLCLVMLLGGGGALLWVLLRGALFVWLVLPLLLLLALHLWIITDASLVARRRAAQYQLRWCNRWPVYVVFSIVVVGLFLLAEQQLLHRCFTVWQVETVCHEGLLRPGDLVLVNRLAFGLHGAPGTEPLTWQRDPDNGEMLLYRDQTGTGTNTERLRLARSVAAAGQRLTHRGGLLVVDDAFRLYVGAGITFAHGRGLVVPQDHLAVLTEQDENEMLPWRIDLVRPSALQGKPMLVIWSVDRERGSLRPGRLGLPVL